MVHLRNFGFVAQPRADASNHGIRHRQLGDTLKGVRASAPDD